MDECREAFAEIVRSCPAYWNCNKRNETRNLPVQTSAAPTVLGIEGLLNPALTGWANL